MEIQEILQGLRQQNSKIQRQIYKKYSVKFKHKLGRHYKNIQNIEEIVNNAFILIFSKIYTFKGTSEEQLIVWMFSILYNQFYNFIKKPVKALNIKSFCHAALEDLELIIDENIESDTNIRKILLSAIKQANLTDLATSICKLRLEGLENKEIAHKLGISGESCKRYWQYYKHKLRKQLI